MEKSENCKLTLLFTAITREYCTKMVGAVRQGRKSSRHSLEMASGRDNWASVCVLQLIDSRNGGVVTNFCGEISIVLNYPHLHCFRRVQWPCRIHSQLIINGKLVTHGQGHIHARSRVNFMLSFSSIRTILFASLLSSSPSH